MADILETIYFRKAFVETTYISFVLKVDRLLLDLCVLQF